MGSPLTDLKARTGELTPPGINSFAASKTFWELVVLKAFVTRPDQIADNTVRHIGLKESNKSKSYFFFFTSKLMKSHFLHGWILSWMARNTANKGFEK